MFSVAGMLGGSGISETGLVPLPALHVASGAAAASDSFTAASTCKVQREEESKKGIQEKV